MYSRMWLKNQGHFTVILFAINASKNSPFPALLGTGERKLIARVPVLFVLGFGAWRPFTPRGGTTRLAFRFVAVVSEYLLSGAPFAVDGETGVVAWP